MTTIKLEIEVPRRIDSWADAQDASDAVMRALNRYLVSNSKTGGEIYQHVIQQPNADLVAVMARSSTRLIRDSDIVELKQYFPQGRWDNVIPMRALLNAFKNMPTVAREALHLAIVGSRSYDPDGPKYENPDA